MKHPAILQVNRESRVETLHHYQTPLKVPFSFLAMGLTQQNTVYFDPVADILALDTVMGFWQNSQAWEILEHNGENVIKARYVIVDRFVWMKDTP